jgi:hypothetical protein
VNRRAQVLHRLADIVAAVEPAARADVVFDTADPASPVLHARVHTSGTKS